MSRLCLCLTGSTLKENREMCLKYASQVDLVEIRADFLEPGELPQLHTFPGQVQVPCILTIRRQADGGRFKKSEQERVNLLRRAATGRYAFVDIEEDLHIPALEEEIRARGGRLIRSIHETGGLTASIPALRTRIETLERSASDLPKAAFMINSTAELVRLVELCRELDGREKIVIGMGSYGFATRVLAEKLGSYLTFCSPPAGTRQAAKGHTDPETMNGVYRFSEIGRDTRVLGIIGNPIMHSFSPLIHNRGLSLLGLDAVYIPLHVDRVPDFFKLADSLSIQGVSVTIPHKQAVIPFLSDRDPTVQAVGACNTIVRREAGWYGTNTDVYGFLHPLLEKVSRRPAPAAKAATVIGAGGAARSIVYALTREGWKLLILNRTPSRAQALAGEFDCAWASLDERGAAQIGRHSDLIVQTTSSGMEPDTTGDPLPWYTFGGHEIVYEIIYNPVETRLLDRAKRAGCDVIYGKHMLAAQAMGQFELFTNCEYPAPEGIELPF